MEEIHLEESAAQKLAEFIESSGGSGHLRLGVIGGGCAGYQYRLALDYQKDDDLSFESHGQTVLVSKEVYPLVSGSEIVYQEGLSDAGFQVNNPHAKQACGCGSSFLVDDDAEPCGAN
jgi:iron-sulfur cluster assembly accessory protein